MNLKFLQWANQHMSAYLGQTPLPPSPPVATPTSTLQQQGAFLQAAGHVLTDLSKQQAKAYEQQEKKKARYRSIAVGVCGGSTDGLMSGNFVERYPGFVCVAQDG